MNSKPIASPKIDFKLVSKKLSIEAVLAVFMSLLLVAPIYFLFFMLVFTISGPPKVESPGEKLIIVGIIVIFLIFFPLFWVWSTKLLFRVTGRYEKLYRSLAETPNKADGNIVLYSKYKTGRSLAYRFGKWIAGLFKQKSV